MNEIDYTGCWPVAPTPFKDNEQLDLEGMKRVLDCMIDQNVDGICILANYSEQFLLSDEERQNGVVTHSSGNFAQAVSLAANKIGVKVFLLIISVFQILLHYIK